MDLDAFVAAHADEWQRLDLLSRRSSLTADEVDELVALYQRVATQLSQVRSAAPDPSLVARLSTLVNRARQRVTGARDSRARDAGRFFLWSFPAALHRLRWLTLAVGLAFVGVGWAAGTWVVGSDEVLAAFGSDTQIRAYCEVQFESYYSENAASSFTAQVSTNNAWIAALSVAGGITGVFPLFVFLQNAFGVGVAGGFMASCGRLDLFFGLITPHGLLELTAVFVALAGGLRLFWAWVDPGARTRVQALGEEGRALVGVAIGLVPVFLLSALVEAFVTPSPLPTWARIAVGVLVWGAFVAYVLVLGRRARLAGHTGDVRREHAGDHLPVAG